MNKNIMPFHIDDWINSVTVNAFSNEEKGVYISMLVAAWAAGGYLKSDELSIRHKYGGDMLIDESWQKVMSKFDRCESRGYYNKKMVSVIDRQTILESIVIDSVINSMDEVINNVIYRQIARNLYESLQEPSRSGQLQKVINNENTIYNIIRDNNINITPSPKPSPSIPSKKGDKLHGSKGECVDEKDRFGMKKVFQAFEDCGKFASLKYEHVLLVNSEHPDARLKENYKQIVLEAEGEAGPITSTLPWLRKRVSALAVRLTKAGYAPKGAPRKRSRFDG